MEGIYGGIYAAVMGHKFFKQKIVQDEWSHI